MSHDGGSSPMYWVSWLVFQNLQTFPGFPGITGVPELLQVVPEGSKQFLGGLDVPGCNWM